MDKRKHHYGWDRLHWEGDVLYFQSQWLVELIPSEVKNHYHLQFFWRNEPTPEIFNVFNARENAREIALHRLNYDMWQRREGASLVSLNEKDDPEYLSG